MRHWLWTPLAIFLASRLVLWGLGAWLSQTFPVEQSIHCGQLARGQWLVDPWLRWDSAYYLDVAAHGYEYAPGERSNVAFFPAYPCLIRLLGNGLGNDAWAAVVVSNLCFLIGCLLFYRLALDELANEGAARRALTYLCLFPSAFIFACGYSESLLLMTAVGAALAARRRRWDWAVALAIWAAACRPTGGAVALLVMHAWYADRAGPRRPSVGAMLLLGPLGLLVVVAYEGIVLGDPQAFLKVQAAWGRGNSDLFSAIFQGIRSCFWSRFTPSLYPAATPVNVVSVLAGLGLTAFVGRRWPAYGLYCLLQILVPAGTGSLMSMSRFLLGAFPIFFVLGEWGRHPLLHRTLLLAFPALQVVLLTMWLNWYFIL